jgi:cell shape-determining protein MreD
MVLPRKKTSEGSWRVAVYTFKNKDKQVGFYIGCWFLGGLVTLLKGVWMGYAGMRVVDLNLLIIITAYLFLNYGATASCGFALGQGFLIDIFSGGLNGLFTTVYFGVFGTIFLSSLFFNLQDVKGQMVIVAFAVFTKSLLSYLVLMFFSQQVVLSIGYIQVTVISILLNSLLAPVLFLLLERLRGVLRSDEAGGSPEKM